MIVNCGGNKIYVDDTLSITSINAIQNKAVSIAINGIVARIDGIDTSIGNIQHDIGEIQGDVADLETGTAKLNGDNVFTGNNQFNVNPKGANPVSGSTDTSLVTTNWISQSGTGKPNNLIHENGIEKFTALKLCAKPTVGALHESSSNNIDGWRKLIISPTFANSNEFNIAIFDLIDNKGNYGRFRLIGRNGNLQSIGMIIGNYASSIIKVSRDSNNEIIIWCHNYRVVASLVYELHAGKNVITFEDSNTIAIFDEPTTDNYAQVITGSW